MKKLLTILTTVCVLIANTAKADTFTIHKIGVVETAEKNSLLDRYLTSDMVVLTGVDSKNNSLIQLNLKAIETLKIQLWNDDGAHQQWRHIVSKAVEWAEIAKKNKVDHGASLGDCGTMAVKCTAKFFAYSDGQKSGITLDVQSKENQFYTAKPLILIGGVKKLKELLEITAPAKIAELRQKPRVNKDELFK